MKTSAEEEKEARSKERRQQLRKQRQERRQSRKQPEAAAAAKRSSTPSEEHLDDSATDVDVTEVEDITPGAVSVPAATTTTTTTTTTANRARARRPDPSMTLPPARPAARRSRGKEDASSFAASPRTQKQMVGATSVLSSPPGKHKASPPSKQLQLASASPQTARRKNKFDQDAALTRSSRNQRQRDSYQTLEQSFQQDQRISRSVPTADTRLNSIPVFDHDDSNQGDDEGVEQQIIAPGAQRVSGINNNDDDVFQSTRSDQNSKYASDDSFNEEANNKHNDTPVVLSSVLVIDDDVDFKKQAQKEAKAKVLSTVTEAHVLTPDEYNNDDDAEVQAKAKSKRLICILIAVVLILVGGVAGFLLSRGGDDGGDNNSVQDNAGTTSPGDSTTDPPQPTLPPTIPPENLQDTCEFAEILDESSLSVSGSTLGARFDPSVPACNSLELGNGRGVWYKMASTADATPGILSASLCDGNADFDTQISVYEGTDCDNLQCVAANDQRKGCGNNDQSQRSFKQLSNDSTNESINYYIFVHGVRGSTGDFTLALTDITAAVTSNECSAPELLRSPTTEDGLINPTIRDEFTVIGTIVNPIATPPPLTCKNTPLSSHGVWYELETSSTGGFLRAQVDSKAQLSIYKNDCDNLRCVTAANNAGTALWTAQPNLKYLILVHENVRVDADMALLDFSLTISPGGVLNVNNPDMTGETVLPRDNEQCESAYTIAFQHDDDFIDVTSKQLYGDNYVYNPLDSFLPPTRMGQSDGNTKFGTVTTTVPNCVAPGSYSDGDGFYFFSRTAPGLWYTVKGTGNVLTASTCDSTLDTQITVLQGSCNDLQCVNANDQFCGDQSSVSWYAEPSEDYTIYVHGVGSRIGTFNLTITEAAIEVSAGNCQGTLVTQASVVGTLENASLATTCLQGNGDIGVPSAWYTIPGTGREMMASTCHPSADVPATQLELYTAAAAATTSDESCDDLACFNSETRIACGTQETIFWQSSADETYRLQVHGQAISGSEDFYLSVNDAPSNLRCEGAIEEVAPWNQATPIHGYASIGRTTNNVAGGRSQCDASLNGASLGAWHKITGVEGLDSMSASVCAEDTSFEAKLTVFKGGACGSLECVATTSGEKCGIGSSVTWQSSPGEDFWILVEGSSPSQMGVYSLTVGAENNFCDSAAGPLQIDAPNPVIASLNFASPVREQHSCFPIPLEESEAGLWYSVEGSAIGQYLRASTCHPETDFDSRINIYTGCGDDTECVPIDVDESCGGQGSNVRWFAQSNELYYILVHGDQSGNFALSIESSATGACEDSFNVANLRDEIDVTFADSSSTRVGESDPCLQTNADRQASWFTFQGTGSDVAIDTCNSAREMQISVADGVCDGLQCAADVVESQCLRTLPTTYGNEYHLLASSAAQSSNGGVGGNIMLSSEHSVCQNAHGPLPIGTSTLGSTVGATFDSSYQTCQRHDNTRPGVWYSIIGTGEVVTAFTCSEFSNFVSQISVFTGTCGSLSCLVGRRQNCGPDAWATFATTVNEVYYIHVSGLSDDGTFVLTIA